MDDAQLVGGLQPHGGLAHPLDRLGGLDRVALLQQIAERRTVEVLHREEDRVALVTDVVDLRDVRVGDRGDGARLPQEQPAGLLVGGHVGAQRLDGDTPVQSRVPALVDHTHAPRPHDGADRIRADAAR